jgi:hypothetical protein
MKFIPLKQTTCALNNLNDRGKKYGWNILRRNHEEDGKREEEVEIFSLSSHAQIHSFNLQYMYKEEIRTRNVKNEGDEVRKFALILSFTISTKHLGLNLF